MPKLITGNYLVRIYDKYGTPIKKLDRVAINHTEAVAYAKKKENKKGRSATVDRRIYNSIDKK